MTETLFERYKEALRAGHVAVVRGRLEDAVSAYLEAISVAGDRAVPRVALGGVHLRLGDPGAALQAFDGALAIAPDDDPAMLGRAQALVVLRRTGEAAATYDRLANVRAGGGHLAEAVEAARRAVAIEPTGARRDHHAALADELRLATAPIAAPAGAEPAAEGTAGPAAGSGAEADVSAGPVLVETGPAPDPEDLVTDAEAAVVRGDPVAAAVAALAAARVYRSRGQVAAAIEACLMGIGARPADAELHLLLATLAVECDLPGHAVEAYRRLLRLAELDSDPSLAFAVRAAAAAHLPTVALIAPG